MYENSCEELARGRGTSLSSLMGKITSDSKFNFSFEANSANFVHGYRSRENRAFSTICQSERCIGSLESVEDIENEFQRIKKYKLQKCQSYNEILSNR